ncbi:hypothetical protein PVL29_018484 [Vitis rotundifolia]|uniref:Uncharacterized protein n=1 Tax=Vitis rotundifolia TaxID=103349 RepID=A0AA39DG97_VITRO|nr:hypothetical protein PVL29_018484 [Vitis rotundifolia]
MPSKNRGRKALAKGSSSKTLKAARDKNLAINPPIQTPSIPKTLAKTFTDGIPFNAFLSKFCKDLYTKVYCERSLVLERQLHLESFLDTPILVLFVKLGWLLLVGLTGTACAPIVCMFYLNIIEHDLGKSYLKLSLFGIVVKVTPEVIVEVLGIPLVETPFVSELKITSELVDRLVLVIHTGSISSPMWVLVTFLTFSVYLFSHRAYICKKGCILFQGQIEGALGSKKKVCRHRAKIQIGEDPSVLAQLWARFDALDEKIYTQSTLLSEQISQFLSHMEKGFSLIDGEMLCNMDQLQALEDFVHKLLS